MTHNPAMAHLLMDLEGESELDPKYSVLELGNQTLNLTEDSPVPRGFGDFKQLNGQSAELYYKALGYERYVCADSNGRHNAAVTDLNTAIAWEQHNLVTNNGTGEHLFNQDNMFRYCHNSCRDGGLMIHLMPFINWINHGFYNFHPLLYVDLANVNKYEIVRLGICNRWGFTEWMHNWPEESQTQQVKPKTILSKSRLGAAIKRVWLDEGRMTDAIFPNIMVIAAFRKLSSAPFRMPIQGKYLDDISSKDIKGHYE